MTDMERILVQRCVAAAICKMVAEVHTSYDDDLIKRGDTLQARAEAENNVRWARAATACFQQITVRTMLRNRIIERIRYDFGL